MVSLLGTYASHQLKVDGEFETMLTTGGCYSPCPALSMFVTIVNHWWERVLQVFTKTLMAAGGSHPTNKDQPVRPIVEKRITMRLSYCAMKASRSHGDR
jgi:hypothetical protein